MPTHEAIIPRGLKMAAARRYSGLGRNTLQKLHDDGTIRGTRTPGGHRVFDRKSIDDYLAKDEKELIAHLRRIGL